MTEAQKRATAAWKTRHNLKLVELLVPADILTSVDETATTQGISRTRFILKAIEKALGNPQPSGEDRLESIEKKLGACPRIGLTAAVSTYPIRGEEINILSDSPLSTGL